MCVCARARTCVTLSWTLLNAVCLREGWSYLPTLHYRGVGPRWHRARGCNCSNGVAVSD